ncbi:MAG: glycosyltransferase family 39 protein [Acidobacteriia bacterium]|nr:glycosyltransferase family 39 protein [Terriglobia bacterium]
MNATLSAARPASVITVEDPSKQRTATVVVWSLAAAKLLLHLLTATRYGVFRDEMYYVACSEHLAWGYVDQPPLIAFLIWITRHLFGESLLGLRLLPALAGALLVWLAARLAREMGGETFSQVLAALAVVVVPIYLILHHWMTMNAFEPLVWMGCIWCVLRAINSGETRYWLWFGVIAGVGFETKYSITFLLMGVLVGVVVTPERHFLKSRHLWLGALAAFLIFLPDFIWLVRHNFPFLELMHNIRMGHRDVARGPVAFVLDQGMIMNPILFPLWIGGLVWLFAGREGRRYRVLGWMYVVMLATFIILKGKNYYLAPVYAMLFAAGAVGLEKITQRHWRWTRAVYAVLMVAAGVVLAPMSVPLLSPEGYIRYQNALGLEPPKSENQNNGPLPQYFADEFGWEDMVREVARIYHGLSPEEQARTAIFGNGYGEASAIDYFGPKYGLPKAISPHQNYWYWGPRNYTGDIVIVLRGDDRGEHEHFKGVEVAGRVGHEYARRDEHYDIFLCRGLKWNLQDVWPKMKRWD